MPVTAPAPSAALFSTRVTREQILRGLGDLARRHPGRPLIVLTDAPGDVPVGAVYVDCRSAALADFRQRSFETPAFLYACSCDDLGVPFVEAIIDAGGTFVPVHEATPASYAHTNAQVRRTLEDEFEDQQLAGFAKWDFGPHDFVNLLQAIDLTAHLTGDVLEVGCYRGSSGSVVVRYLHERRLTRRCHFLDVFDGFTYDQATASADAHWAGTHVTEGQARVEARLRRFEAPGVGATVTVTRCNVITDDLPADLGPLVVANIDVDLYEAVDAALRKVAPRIVRGGILIVEDPGHTPLLIGARVALTRFLRTDLARRFMPIYMQSGQTLLICLGDLP